VRKATATPRNERFRHNCSLWVTASSAARAGRLDGRKARIGTIAAVEAAAAKRNTHFIPAMPARPPMKGPMAMATLRDP